MHRVAIPEPLLGECPHQPIETADIIGELTRSSSTVHGAPRQHVQDSQP